MLIKVAVIFTVCLLAPALCMEQIVGIIGEPIHIACPGASTEALVTWMDRVYNQQDAPQTIYVSDDNPDFKVDSTHPHYENYMVDQEYTLTIKNLSMEDGGEYICGIEGDENNQNKFDLMVVGKPMCSGSPSASAGGQVELMCEVKYRGSMPTVNWFSPEGTEVRSDDLTEIRLMKKRLTLEELSAQDDKQIYMCKLSIGDFMETCSMTLDVKYPPTKVDLMPRKDSYNAGETIKCMADGNPSPKITFQPEGETTMGDGWTALTVREEWVGSKQEIICTASSENNGSPVVLTTNVTFAALEAIKTTTTEMPYKPQATEKTGAATKGTNQAGIIGGLIAAVAIIIIIVVIVVIVRKRSSKKPKGAKPVPTSDPKEKRDPASKGMTPLTTLENGRHSNNNPHDNGDVALSNNSWTEKQRHSRTQPPFDPRAKNVEGLTYADLDLNSEENHNAPLPPPPASPWETRGSNGYEYAPIRNP